MKGPTNDEDQSFEPNNDTPGDIIDTPPPAVIVIDPDDDTADILHLLLLIPRLIILVPKLILLIVMTSWARHHLKLLSFSLPQVMQ